MRVTENITATGNWQLLVEADGEPVLVTLHGQEGEFMRAASLPNESNRGHVVASRQTVQIELPADNLYGRAPVGFVWAVG